MTKRSSDKFIDSVSVAVVSVLFLLAGLLLSFLGSWVVIAMAENWHKCDTAQNAGKCAVALLLGLLSFFSVGLVFKR